MAIYSGVARRRRNLLPPGASATGWRFAACNHERRMRRLCRRISLGGDVGVSSGGAPLCFFLHHLGRKSSMASAYGDSTHWRRLAHLASAASVSACTSRCRHITLPHGTLQTCRPWRAHRRIASGMAKSKNARHIWRSINITNAGSEQYAISVN